MTQTRTPTLDQFTGALLGLAVGDALGRPTEGKRQPEIGQRPRDRPGGSRLAFRAYRDGRLGRELPPGSWSDDTQQALLLAESLVARGGFDAQDYAGRLYALWRSGEARGYGRVYQKAMQRRDAGQPWDAVAVDDDTMNGAAMRIAPLGLFYWFDPAALTEAAVRSSHVTHRHPAAVAGAAGIALAFGYALTHAALDATALVDHLRHHVAPLDAATADHLGVLLRAVELDPGDAFAVLAEVPEFTTPDGLGVGGMTIGLLLIALYLYLHTKGDYLASVEHGIRLGGDNDGTVATAGALCAAASATPPPAVRVPGGLPASPAQQKRENRRDRAGPRCAAAPAGRARSQPCQEPGDVVVEACGVFQGGREAEHRGWADAQVLEQRLQVLRIGVGAALPLPAQSSAATTVYSTW